MTGMCRTFKCLPGPGGLLEQDSLMVWAMTVVLDAQAERDAREQKKMEADAKRKR